MSCTIILKNGVRETCDASYVDAEGHLVYERVKKVNPIKRFINFILRREPQMEDLYFNPDDIMISIFDREVEDDVEYDTLELTEVCEGADESLTYYA